MEGLAPPHQPVPGYSEGPPGALIGEGCVPVPFQPAGSDWDQALAAGHRHLIKGLSLAPRQGTSSPDSSGR